MKNPGCGAYACHPEDQKNPSSPSRGAPCSARIPKKKEKERVLALASCNTHIGPESSHQYQPERRPADSVCQVQT